MRCSIGFAMLFVCHRSMEMLLVGSVPHSVVYFLVAKRKSDTDIIGSKVKIWQELRYYFDCNITDVTYTKTEQKFVCCQSRSSCFDIMLSHLEYILILVCMCMCVIVAHTTYRRSSLWIFCKANSYLFGSGLQKLSDLGFTYEQGYSFMAGIEMWVIHAVKKLVTELLNGSVVSVEMHRKWGISWC